ncbi:MAG: hypothetical protein M3P26_14575 [Gemmatimonadota bacterium]|nr:hypothetical protein [Gemmatimonadota bacterium]
MAVVRSIVAVLFVVMAVGIFARYTTVRRWGLLLGAMTYGVAGILAFVLGAWWPLVLGFALAWVLGRVGADPRTDLRLDLPTIERTALADASRVRDYLKRWITEDPQVGLVTSGFVRDAWRVGWRRPSSIPNDESWTATSAEEAWFRKTYADMRALASAPKSEFLAHLDSIDALGTRTLIDAGETARKYDLPSTPTDLPDISSRIASEAEMRAYSENYVADVLLAARLRVLAWTYQYWHGERYEVTEKRQP